MYEESFKVRAYEAGAGRVASLPVLANYMQEAAGNHAAALGFGIATLLDRGETWVLSRLRVTIDRYPGWGEKVRVVTWPAGTSRLWALREFRLLDERGAGIGRASSAWLLIDLERRRPLRPPALIDELAAAAPEPAPADLLERLPEVGAPQAGCEHPIRVADTDVNRHANNVALLALALEALPDRLLGLSGPSAADLEFRAEAAHGDLLLGEWAGERVVRHRLVRRSDGREVVRAVTRWPAH